MIIAELIENGERIHHYSDEGFKILQVETGHIYEDAIDIMPCRYTYEETDIPIPPLIPDDEEPIEEEEEESEEEEEIEE